MLYYIKKLVNIIIIKVPFADLLFITIRKYLNIIDDFLRKLLNKKPIIYNLSVHVTDHCNLNCTGCGHFCNLVKNKVFLDIEQYKKDLYRMAEMFDNIHSFNLIGGEPLLHDKLHLIIQITREVFPKTKISILSNGLLYKQLSHETLSIIKAHNVIMRITLYNPMIKHKEEIINYFSSYGIKFYISKPVEKFIKYFSLEGNNDKNKSFRKCIRARCTFLWNGYISPCELPSLIKYFNEHFNTEVNMEKSHFNIHDLSYDGFRLKKELFKPLEACRYCDELVFFDWSIGKEPKIEDFCVL